MIAADQFRLHLLQKRRRAREMEGAVISALSVYDKHVHILDLAEASSSKSVVKRLCDALPGEHEALHFDSIDDLATRGVSMVHQWMPESVTLHFGWDHVALRTTFLAAWSARPAYAGIDDVLTFNACIYPDSLLWYVVVAGRNLYVMDCSASPSPTGNVHENIHSPRGATELAHAAERAQRDRSFALDAVARAR